MRELIEEFIAVVLIGICWLTYVFVIKPRRDLDNYARLFEQRGFKVFKYPFKFMQAPGVDFWQQKQTGNDVLSIMKNEYYKYDVVLSNFAHSVMIEYINP